MAVQKISPLDAYHLRQHEPDAPAIIDVRTPAEYEQVHALGTQSVPLDELDPGMFKDESNSKSNRRLLVICKSGRRAVKACETNKPASPTSSTSKAAPTHG